MPVDEILSQATAEHEFVADNQSLTSRGSSHHSADTFDSFSDNTLDNSDSANHRPSSLGLANQRHVDSLSSSQDSALLTAIAIYDYKVECYDYKVCVMITRMCVMITSWCVMIKRWCVMIIK